jgi:hypothetical protein
LRVFATEPSNISQNPEIIRHTIAIDVLAYIARPIPVTALATPKKVSMTV